MNIAIPARNNNGFRKAPPKDPKKSETDSRQISMLIRVLSKKKERDMVNGRMIDSEQGQERRVG